ncbi:MAG TPA: ribosomal protein S18-alanine N-acetyltransferase [Terracidiphilus sp.]
MESFDIEAVMAIEGSLAPAPHWPRDAYARMLEPGAVPARVALVAETAEREILGFAIALFIPPEAELETIAVAAGAQRQGIARQLFYDLAGELRKSGVTEVTLEVRGSNAGAQGFYASLGFTPTRVRRGYYNDPKEDAIVMASQFAGRSGAV